MGTLYRNVWTKYILFNIVVWIHSWKAYFEILHTEKKKCVKKCLPCFLPSSFKFVLNIALFILLMNTGNEWYPFKLYQIFAFLRAANAETTLPVVLDKISELMLCNSSPNAAPPYLWIKEKTQDTDCSLGWFRIRYWQRYWFHKKDLCFSSHFRDTFWRYFIIRVLVFLLVFHCASLMAYPFHTSKKLNKYSGIKTM